MAKSNYDRTAVQRNKRRRQLLKAAGWIRTDVHYDPDNERHRALIDELNASKNAKIAEEEKLLSESA